MEIANDPAKFRKREFDDLGDAIVVIEEAGKCTPPMMGQMMLEVMRKRFTVIQKACHLILASHQTIATRQNALELSEAKKDLEWAEAVVPGIVVPASGETIDWCIHKRPEWWAIKDVFDSGNDQKLWVESIFTSSFWN